MRFPRLSLFLPALAEAFGAAPGAKRARTCRVRPKRKENQSNKNRAGKKRKSNWGGEQHAQRSIQAMPGMPEAASVPCAQRRRQRMDWCGRDRYREIVEKKRARQPCRSAGGLGRVCAVAACVCARACVAGSHRHATRGFIVAGDENRRDQRKPETAPVIFPAPPTAAAVFLCSRLPVHRRPQGKRKG